MKAQRPNPRPLDHTDWQLVRRLQENARLSYHELGRQIGLSATAVAERVRRMEQSGVITGYHAQVDPTQVGLPIVAFIQTTWIGTLPTRDCLESVVPKEGGEKNRQHRSGLCPSQTEVILITEPASLPYAIVTRGLGRGGSHETRNPDSSDSQPSGRCRRNWI